MAFNITSLSNIWSTFKDEVKEYLNRSIDKTGDTMTGTLTMENTLTLAEDPDVIDTFNQNREAASKGYVEMLSGFMPGDTLLQNLNIRDYPNVEKFYTINIGEEHGLQITNCKLTPKASGLLSCRYCVSCQCVNFRTNNGYVSPITKTNYVTLRLKVIYHLDGYDDVILYDDSITCKDTNGFRSNDIAVLLPMEKGKTGVIQASFTFEDYCLPSSAYTIISMRPLSIAGGLYYGNDTRSVAVAD